MNELHKQSFPYTAGSKEEHITVQALDTFIRDKSIDLQQEILIKIDVQGFEDKVITGGLNTFERAVVVITEISFQELYHGQPLFDDIYTRLKGLGYKLVGFIDEGGYAPNSGLPLYANAIFVKNRIDLTEG